MKVASRVKQKYLSKDPIYDNHVWGLNYYKFEDSPISLTYYVIRKGKKKKHFIKDSTYYQFHIDFIYKK